MQSVPHIQGRGAEKCVPHSRFAAGQPRCTEWWSGHGLRPGEVPAGVVSRECWGKVISGKPCQDPGGLQCGEQLRQDDPLAGFTAK